MKHVLTPTRVHILASKLVMIGEVNLLINIHSAVMAEKESRDMVSFDEIRPRDLLPPPDTANK